MFAVNSDPDWTAGRAACIGQWDLHAPAEKADGSRETTVERRRRVQAAIAMCNRCPMLDECRTWTFQNRPHDTVSGGLDLTGESPLTEKTPASDAAIYWRRIEAVLAAEKVHLTDYQRWYVDESLHGRSPRWNYAGRQGRSAGARTRCEALLADRRVRFSGAA